MTAFEELKQRQAATWGAAPFENVEATIADMHDELVSRLAPQPGERLLDLGCGTGAVATRAARAGASVTGLDLSPALVETARRRAAAEGLDVEYVVGDCEDLPFADASFDCVCSSVGFIFAPDHARAAGELARACRPDGRIALTSWRPESGVGSFFRLVSAYQPSPPEGAGNPLDWGREEYVEDLLGPSFELELVEGTSVLTGASGQELWELLRDNFGPLKALHGSLPPERAEHLAGAVADFYEADRVDGEIRHERRYLLILGTRR